MNYRNDWKSTPERMELRDAIDAVEALEGVRPEDVQLVVFRLRAAFARLTDERPWTEGVWRAATPPDDPLAMRPCDRDGWTEGSLPPFPGIEPDQPRPRR